MTIYGDAEIEFWDDLFARYMQAKGVGEQTHAYVNAGYFADRSLEERRKRKRVQNEKEAVAAQ